MSCSLFEIIGTADKHISLWRQCGIASAQVLADLLIPEILFASRNISSDLALVMSNTT